MMVIDVLSGVLLAAGALFVVSGAVGLLRFPDFYPRIHAAGVTDSAGAGLIVLGLLLRADSWQTAVRLVVILLFMALTNPTSTHALANAARRDGVPIAEEGGGKR